MINLDVSDYIQHTPMNLNLASKYDWQGEPDIGDMYKFFVRGIYDL